MPYDSCDRTLQRIAHIHSDSSMVDVRTTLIDSGVTTSYLAHTLHLYLCLCQCLSLHVGAITSGYY